MNSILKLSFHDGIKKVEFLSLILTAIILSIYFIHKQETLSNLHSSGIVQEAIIINVSPKKGSLVIGRILPSYTHVARINNQLYNITLQRVYSPGKIHIKWVPPTTKQAPSVRAIALNENDSYSYADLLGGRKAIFIMLAGMILLMGSYFFIITTVIKKARSIMSWRKK